MDTKQKITRLEQAIAILKEQDKQEQRGIEAMIDAIDNSNVMFFDTIKQAYAVFCPGGDYTLQQFRTVFKRYYNLVSVRAGDHKVIKQYRSNKYKKPTPYYTLGDDNV